MPLAIPLFFVGLAKKPLSAPLVLTRSAIDTIASRIVETIQLLDASSPSSPSSSACPAPSPIATLIKNHGRLDTACTLAVVELLASALSVKRLGVRAACVQMEALLAVRVKTQVKRVALDALVGKAGRAVTWLPRRVDRMMRKVFGDYYLANCAALFEVLLSCALERVQHFFITNSGQPTLLALTYHQSTLSIAQFHTSLCTSLCTSLASLPSTAYSALSSFLDFLALQCQCGEITFLGELAECILQVYALGLGIANICLAFVGALTFVEGEDEDGEASLGQVRSVRQLARETPVGAAGGIFGGEQKQQQRADVGEGPSGTRRGEVKQDSGKVEEPTTPNTITDKKGKGKEQAIEMPVKPKAEGSSKLHAQNPPPLVAKAKPYVTSTSSSSATTAASTSSTSATGSSSSSKTSAQENQGAKHDTSYSLNASSHTVETRPQTNEPNSEKEKKPESETKPKQVSEIVREIVANMSKKEKESQNPVTASVINNNNNGKTDIVIVGGDKPAVGRRPALQETTNMKRSATATTTTTSATATITSRPAHHPPAGLSYQKQRNDENALPSEEAGNRAKGEARAKAKAKAKGNANANANAQGQQVGYDFGVVDRRTSATTSTATTAIAVASTSTTSPAADAPPPPPTPPAPLKFRDGMSRRERRLMFQELVKMRLLNSGADLEVKVKDEGEDEDGNGNGKATDDAVDDFPGVDGQKNGDGEGGGGGSEVTVMEQMEVQNERPQNASVVSYPSTESICVRVRVDVGSGSGSSTNLLERAKTVHANSNSDGPCTPQPTSQLSAHTRTIAMDDEQTTLDRPTFDQPTHVPSPSQSSITNEHEHEHPTPTPLSNSTPTKANTETPMSTPTNANANANTETPMSTPTITSTETPMESTPTNPDTETPTSTTTSANANTETPTGTTNPDTDAHEQPTTSGSVVSFYSKFSAPRPEREVTRYAPAGMFGSVALPALSSLTPLQGTAEEQDPFIQSSTNPNPETNQETNQEVKPMPIRIPWFPQAAPNRSIPTFWDPPAPYVPIKITPPMRKRRGKGGAGARRAVLRRLSLGDTTSHSFTAAPLFDSKRLTGLFVSFNSEQTCLFLARRVIRSISLFHGRRTTPSLSAGYPPKQLRRTVILLNFNGTLHHLPARPMGTQRNISSFYSITGHAAVSISIAAALCSALSSTNFSDAGHMAITIAVVSLSFFSPTTPAVFGGLASIKAELPRFPAELMQYIRSLRTMPFTHNLPAPNTMANPAFSLRDNEHFPSLRGITVDNIFDGNTLDYYSEQGQTGILRPAKHWCLLTEIVEERQWIRPMYTVEDKAGDQFLVAFHHDYDGTPGFRVSETFGMPASRRLPESLAKNAKPGSVMAFMYAQNHMFADGQQGIRVEDLDQVKTFPCSLKTLLRIGDEVNLTLENCQMCNKSAYLSLELFLTTT
ncbi:unnamed protein product [Cyclocybe aegerita]|uniref:Uncharacterized protein n=1 Tax=Cyclocybe aegerita TaxID=1973307 RepID=A0A8S0VSE9_CYCAE|nr:unnamed protein product [Cyclocybe aegerita]